MYCVSCDKDISWFEVHLQQNHQTELRSYLRDFFDVATECSSDGLIDCYICGNRVKWLQDHLYNKHREFSLLDYIQTYYIDSEKLEVYVDVYKQVAEENRPRKKKTVTRLNKLTEADEQVLAFQRGEVCFSLILERWKRPLRVQLNKSLNLIPDLAKQESLRDLEQELHTVLYTAAKTYDSDKAVFNTYVWNCVSAHLATVSSYNKAGKRNFFLVGAEDVLSYNRDESIENNDKVSLLHYMNSEDDSDEGIYLEFYEGLDKVQLPPAQRLVVQAFLNNLSRKQIRELLMCKNGTVDRLIRELRENKRFKHALVSK